MSQYLLFESDPIDQPAATDPVERASWCALRVRVGSRFASRIWDRSIPAERTNLYVPAFPVAAWLVENWWSLFNEVCPWDQAPTLVLNEEQLNWTRRHCLRSADSSLLLPALYLFHDGRSLRAEWQADVPGAMPNMPGEFVAAGAEQLEACLTQQSLTSFINDCLSRVSQLDDRRVRQLVDDWQAIQQADSEEQDFCSLAGRMGLDPYDDSDMTAELAQFLEQSCISSQDPLLRDLMEVARRESIVDQWTWLANIAGDLKLGPNPLTLSLDIPSTTLLPHRFGYELANNVRSLSNVPASAPLGSVEEIAQSVTGRVLRFEDRNHVPGQGIRAVVGRSSGDIVCAGPTPRRPDNRRFVTARSLYHALVTTHDSHRLVTDAHSWEQKASRAFAAELLAPQQAIVDRVSASGADLDTVESLSREFNVSTVVIENQLGNAGLSVSAE